MDNSRHPRMTVPLSPSPVKLYLLYRTVLIYRHGSTSDANLVRPVTRQSCPWDVSLSLLAAPSWTRKENAPWEIFDPCMKAIRGQECLICVHVCTRFLISSDSFRSDRTCFNHLCAIWTQVHYVHMSQIEIHSFGNQPQNLTKFQPTLSLPLMVIKNKTFA